MFSSSIGLTLEVTARDATTYRRDVNIYEEATEFGAVFFKHPTALQGTVLCDAAAAAGMGSKIQYSM